MKVESGVPASIAVPQPVSGNGLSGDTGSGDTVSGDVLLGTLVEELHDVLDRLTVARDRSDISAEVALTASGRLGSAKARVDAVLVSLATRLRAEATRAGGAPRAVGTMLAGEFGGDRREGNAVVVLAQQLADATATGEALAAGRVSKDQAQVIARGLAALPPAVSDADRAAAERSLLADAPEMPLPDLQRRARRMREAFESVHEADAHENDQLEVQERSAWEQASFWMKEWKPGLFKGGFLLPEVQAQMLRAAVEAISAPRRFHLMDTAVPPNPSVSAPDWARPSDLDAVEPSSADAEGRASRVEPGSVDGKGRAPTFEPTSVNAQGWTPTVGQLEADLDAADAAEAAGLPLDKQHREGRALAQLCEHLPADKLPNAGGVSAILSVNFDFETLAQGVRAATLSTGTRMSAGEARRWACNADLIPQVFGGASLPLDLGRSRRLFSKSQRLAVANRDGGCAFPNCGSPPEWCEGHHWRQPWSRGGTTDLADLAPLCSSDHRRVHVEDIPIRLRDGRLEFFVRPPGGGERQWLSNRRFRVGPNAQ